MHKVVDSNFVYQNTSGWRREGRTIVDNGGFVIARCPDDTSAEVLMRGVRLQRATHEDGIKSEKGV